MAPRCPPATASHILTTETGLHKPFAKSAMQGCLMLEKIRPAGVNDACCSAAIPWQMPHYNHTSCTAALQLWHSLRLAYAILYATPTALRHSRNISSTHHATAWQHPQHDNNVLTVRIRLISACVRCKCRRVQAAPQNDHEHSQQGTTFPPH